MQDIESVVIYSWSIHPFVGFWAHDPYSVRIQGNTKSREGKGKGKGKGNVDLYSAYSRMPLMCSDMDHTVLPANNTISAFTCKHSPGGTTTHIHIANAAVQLTTHLSTPRGWMAELAMLADIADSLLRWGHLSIARRGAGQGKFAGHRLTF